MNSGVNITFNVNSDIVIYLPENESLMKKCGKVGLGKIKKRWEAQRLPIYMVFIVTN